jgi:hypothetical protein
MTATFALILHVRCCSFLEKDAGQWVLHGGCLNEVGNLYGGSEMVARVGKAIKEEMVLERMEEGKKNEEEWKKGEVFLVRQCGGRKDRKDRTQTAGRATVFGGDNF